MTVNIYRDGKVHVRDSECAQCLFSPDRIVPGSRAAQIVRHTKSSDGASFVCHRSQTQGEAEAICAGWWSRFATSDPIMQLAIARGIVVEVHP